jgi:hypothetical protein
LTDHAERWIWILNASDWFANSPNAKRIRSCWCDGNWTHGCTGSPTLPKNMRGSITQNWIFIIGLVIATCADWLKKPFTATLLYYIDFWILLPFSSKYGPFDLIAFLFNGKW